MLCTAVQEAAIDRWITVVTIEDNFALASTSVKKKRKKERLHFLRNNNRLSGIDRGCSAQRIKRDESSDLFEILIPVGSYTDSLSFLLHHFLNVRDWTRSLTWRIWKLLLRRRMEFGGKARHNVLYERRLMTIRLWISVQRHISM